jgi:hypothetical protein
MGATVRDEPWPLFWPFLLMHTVGPTPWTWDQPAASLLPTQDNKNTELMETSGPRSGFEHTIPVF